MKLSSKLTAFRYKCVYKSLIFFNRNNLRTKQYQQEGLKILADKVDKLPDEIAFRPSFISQSSCVKVFDKLYLFISKSNIKKPVNEKFDALFHEIGHWLHFQQIPPLKICREIWHNADTDTIKKEVSDYAIKKNDGREFVAEVFKGLVKGKKYSEYIMTLYKNLNGPKIKE